MIDKIFVFLLVFACSSCCVYSNDEAVPEHIIAYDKVENRYVQDMRRKYNATVIGSGGAMMKNIKHAYLCFRLNGAVDVEKARALYIEFVKNLLEQLNSDEQVRPYLETYPFTEKEISIQLTFYLKGNKRPSEQNIALVSMGSGVIRYNVFDPKLDNYRIVYTEPYNKALEIVRNQK